MQTRPTTLWTASFSSKKISFQWTHSAQKPGWSCTIKREKRFGLPFKRVGAATLSPDLLARYVNAVGSVLTYRHLKCWLGNSQHTGAKGVPYCSRCSPQKPLCKHKTLQQGVAPPPPITPPTHTHIPLPPPPPPPTHTPTLHIGDKMHALFNKYSGIMQHPVFLVYMKWWCYSDCNSMFSLLHLTECGKTCQPPNKHHLRWALYWQENNR